MSPIAIQEPGSRFRQSLARDFQGVAIAWSRNLGSFPVDPAVTAVLESQRSVFADLGCVVEEGEPDFADADEIFNIWRAWSFEVGYTKNNLKLPIKDQGRVITLKNDVTFRMNMSVTNNRTIQRKIEEVNTVTNGNINFQLRPNVSYVVNQKLNIQLYFERNVNEPLVTNSYKRSTTRFGTKIQFNLAQ